MRELIIQADDAGQRVDKFLMKTCKTMPKSLMYKYIRNKKIKVNRKRCEISQRLVEGDTMQCFIAEEFFDGEVPTDFLQVPSQLDVVYEDEDILVVNKPIGLLAQKDQAGIQDNLGDRILHYLYQKNVYDPYKAQSFKPSLAHRIDRNTQGLMIAAKNAESLRVLNEKFKLHEIRKYYVCIVEGFMEQKEADLIFYHEKVETNNRATVYDTPRDGAQEIKSHYKVLEEGTKHSLLEVEITTGKSHQIRASLAHIGHPLLGDVKYGARKVNDFPYQALCSYRLSLAWQSDARCLNALKDKEILLKNIMLLQYFNEHCR